MKYIILEIQKSFDGTVALTPAIVKDNLLDAESTFHSILAAAALSSLAFHSAVILNDEGGLVKGGGYPHDPPTQEPEEKTSGAADESGDRTGEAA